MLNDIILKHEQILDEFIQWQIDCKATNKYLDYAEMTTDAKEIPKYASILYKEYIEVEGVILWKDHFKEENWKQWRKGHSPLDSANVINHVHVDMMMPLQVSNGKYLVISAEIIALFWNAFLKSAFPNTKASVCFDGDAIFIQQ